MVQRLAKARLERLDTLPHVRRREVSREALLSALVSDLRRQLSLQAVRQQARLLIDGWPQWAMGEGQLPS